MVTVSGVPEVGSLSSFTDSRISRAIAATGSTCRSFLTGTPLTTIYWASPRVSNYTQCSKHVPSSMFVSDYEHFGHIKLGLQQSQFSRTVVSILTKEKCFCTFLWVFYSLTTQYLFTPWNLYIYPALPSNIKCRSALNGHTWKVAFFTEP